LIPARFGDFRPTDRDKYMEAVPRDQNALTLISASRRRVVGKSALGKQAGEKIPQKKRK